MWLSVTVEFASRWGLRIRRPFRMVRPEGLEPPAYWFEASRSIQLSYGRTPQ